MKHYLDLDFKTGTFYSYSGTQKDGYEAHTSSTGNTSYRKFFKKGIYGTLKTAYFKDDEIYGMQVRMILENGNEWFMLKFPIKSSQGRLDSFLESLISYLPNMELGEPYRIFPYRMDVKTDSGKDVTRRGISVVEAFLNNNGFGTPGDKIEKTLRYLSKDEAYDDKLKKDPNVVPKLEFKPLAGKMMPSAISLAIKTEFFEDILQKQIERLDVQPEQDPEEEVPATKAEAPKNVAKNDEKFKKAAVGVELTVEDDDDLPF